MIGEVTDRGLLRAFHHGAEVGDIPVVDAGRRTRPRYELAPERPGPAARTSRRAVRRAGRPDRRAARAAGLAELRAAGAGSRASTTSWSARARSCGPGGDAARRAADARPARAIAISLDGNGRRTWLDPRRGGDERRLRGGPQRRLHRRAAGRGDQLPQLRQPGDRRGRLRAGRGDRGHVAGLRGARAAGRVGQRVALQRAHRPADPPDAGGRRGRLLDDAVAGRARPRSATRATSCCWPAPARRRSTARRTRRSCWATVERPHPRARPRDTSGGCTSFLAAAAEARAAAKRPRRRRRRHWPSCVAEAAIAGAIGVTARGRRSVRRGRRPGRDLGRRRADVAALRGPGRRAAAARRSARWVAA